MLSPMDPVMLFVLVLIAVGGGIVGALFGLGGGIIFVPVLTILFGLDVTAASAASLIGVVATSSGSAAVYLKKGLPSIRVGMFLEISTCIGAAVGAFMAAYLADWLLCLIFAGVMIYNGYIMAFSPTGRSAPQGGKDSGRFTWTDTNGTTGEHTVDHLHSGAAMCTGAGALSAMTGVGGGTIKVPIMNIYMHIPIKTAAATSNYMIGLTAFTGAIVYFIRGQVLPEYAAAVAVGAFIGATIGTVINQHVNARAQKRYFSVIAFLVAALMLLRAGGIL
ncbi:MAG: sulfite exporter TauE/SafE family protein [Candidatus Methanomethylophilus sp.]|nr:sulfite exporter TauE/SafE family protein [Methanomethylophilus sp.]MDD3232691.1 sulfite exporter TauE/SafE family protein [Methanomethylophilus sp.]MDD4221541.1 sulfite exporter TauE/SafE family protein [Methanomethylophilus sp.]